MKRTLTQRVFFNTLAANTSFSLVIYGSTRETTEGIILAIISFLLCLGFTFKIADWDKEERNSKKIKG